MKTKALRLSGVWTLIASIYVFVLASLLGVWSYIAAVPLVVFALLMLGVIGGAFIFRHRTIARFVSIFLLIGYLIALGFSAISAYWGDDYGGFAILIIAIPALFLFVLLYPPVYVSNRRGDVSFRILLREGGIILAAATVLFVLIFPATMYDLVKYEISLVQEQAKLSDLEPSALIQPDGIDTDGWTKVSDKELGVSVMAPSEWISDSTEGSGPYVDAEWTLYNSQDLYEVKNSLDPPEYPETAYEFSVRRFESGVRPVGTARSIFRYEPVQLPSGVVLWQDYGYAERSRFYGAMNIGGVQHVVSFMPSHAGYDRDDYDTPYEEQDWLMRNAILSTLELIDQ